MSLLKIFSRTNRVFEAALSPCSIPINNKVCCALYRGYKKRRNDDGCRRACVDIPPDPNPICPEPCNRWGKKKNGILHKIKLKIMEGGSNFGSKAYFLLSNNALLK